MALAFKDLHWANDIDVDQYLQPETISEALDMLKNFDGTARIISGGTDVVPQLRRRDVNVKALVDISRIPDMNGIEADGEDIVLGGLVTHGQAASSTLIREKAELLARGAGSVGSPQIRNIATVSGNLVSGQPAADTSIPLLALNAQVTITSAGGEKTVPLTQFFVDTGKTILDCSREILTSIRFKALKKDEGSCYLRLAKRKALTLPMLVVAAVVSADQEKNTINRAAIAMGPVAPVPYRAVNVEAWLKEKPISEETFETAAGMGMQDCTPRDSCLRGSCDYRTEMAKVLMRRALKGAVSRIGA